MIHNSGKLDRYKLEIQEISALSTHWVHPSAKRWTWVNVPPRSRPPNRLWSAYAHLGSHEHFVLEFLHGGRHSPVDEPRVDRSAALRVRKKSPTMSSNCYALGMLIYETISGNPPFHQHKNHTVSSKVVRGEHPPRGVGSTDTLWKTLELCWMSQPDNRPSIQAVLQRLGSISNFLELVPPGIDEEMERDDSGWGSASSILNGTSDMMVTESVGIQQQLPNGSTSSLALPATSPATLAPTYFFVVPQTFYGPSAKDGGWERAVPVGFEGIKLTDAANPYYLGLRGFDDRIFD